MKKKLKKIIVAHSFEQLLTGKGSLLDRANIRLFTAATNDELLELHTRERASVIVTSLEMPGIRPENLFTELRDHDELRDFSVIFIIKDTLVQRERCRRCRANAIFTVPVDAALLSLKVLEFINVSPRKRYRTAVAVGIQGKFKDMPQQFWTENVSSRGMLIRTREPLARGDGIFFSFFLPDGRHVCGYGEIARVALDKAVKGVRLYGIRFTNIDPADVAALNEFIGHER